MDAGSRSRARLLTADAMMGEWRRDWTGTLSPTHRAAHSPLLGEEFSQFSSAEELHGGEAASVSTTPLPLNVSTSVKSVKPARELQSEGCFRACCGQSAD